MHAQHDESRTTMDGKAAHVDASSGATAREEHFIPIRKADVIRLLASQLPSRQEDPFRDLCRLLEAMLHYQYHCKFERLKDAYALFNPDAITKDYSAEVVGDREQLAQELIAQARELLESANYRRLSGEEIQQAIGTASEWGLRLHLDLEIFKHLEIYSRGSTVAHRTLRRSRKLYRTEQVPLEIYQRLIVIFQLRGPDPAVALDNATQRDSLEDPVHFKLFKNIPRADIDMLLPGSRFRMSLMDRGKIVLPTISGIVIATMKIVKGTIFAMVAGFWGILAFLGFAGGTIGYGIKSFFEYMRTKEKYQLNLTRSLYYQNLDNNAGVLFRLLDEAEEQEFREAIVAYWLLMQGPPDGLEVHELDVQAEQWLADVLGFRVDFEVRDALDKLSRLGCAKRVSGRWQAESLGVALAHMDRAWDGIFTHRHPQPAPEDDPCEL